MLIYALKRLAYVALILAVMSVLIFWATQVMPGDVAQMIVGQFATDEQIRAVRAKLRLDDPIHVQYLRWAGALLSLAYVMYRRLVDHADEAAPAPITAEPPAAKME